MARQPDPAAPKPSRRKSKQRPPPTSGTSATTLFVRNLHPDTTSEQLAAHFAGVGPLRRAFVVTDRQTSESRRVAFVQFALPAHAAAARHALHHSTLHHRRISVEPARPRNSDVGDGGGEAGEAEGNAAAGDAPKAGGGGGGGGGAGAAKRDAKLNKGAGAPPMRTVVLRCVPAENESSGKGAGSGAAPADVPDEQKALDVLQRASLPAPESVVVVAADTKTKSNAAAAADPALRLTFASWAVAGRAAAALHAVPGLAAVIDALAATSRATVIVRNLPFRVDRVEIRAKFAAAAPVRDVRVPPPKQQRQQPQGRGPRGGRRPWASGQEDDEGGENDDAGKDEAVGSGKRDHKSNDSDSDSEPGDNDNPENDSDGDNDSDSESDSDSDDETAKARAVAAESAASAPKLPETDVVECPGYAFVEFFLVADAKHAMRRLNGAKIGGRVVAVDLAVDRSDYQARKARAEAEELEDGSDKEEDDNDEAATETQDGDPVDNSGGGDEKSNDSEEEEEGNGDEAEEGEAKKSQQKSASSTPEELERTIFVRNLLFETSSQELRKAMQDAFGPVENALLVMHRVTRRPRGTGFVRFKSAKSAQNAIAASGQDASDETAIVLQGRRLLLSLAVDRTRASELKDDKPAAENDEGENEKKQKSRNMHLAWAGLIERDSEEANGMSEQDFVRREKAAQEKRKKLAHNPNAFVSDVRLSVRNLPRDMDEKTFKQMFIVAARAGLAAKRAADRGKKKKKKKQSEDEEGAESGSTLTGGEDVRITHCKIIRNEERNARSKCFGFIQFARHEDAMHAFRKLDNNPDAMEWTIKERPRALRLNDAAIRHLREMWGKERRLLVEFAVEDRRMVNRIEQIKMRGRQKSEEVKAARARGHGAQPSSGGDGSRKHERKRRRGKETANAGDDQVGGSSANKRARLSKHVRESGEEGGNDAAAEAKGAGVQAAKKKAGGKSKRNLIQKLRRQRRLAKDKAAA